MLNLNQIDYDSTTVALQVDIVIQRMQNTSADVMSLLTQLALNLHVHGQNAHLIKFIEGLPERSKGGIASKDIIDWFVEVAQCCHKITLKNGVAKVIVDKDRRRPDILTAEDDQAEALRELIAEPEFVKISKPQAFDHAKKAMQFLSGNYRALCELAAGTAEAKHNPLDLAEFQMTVIHFIAIGAVTESDWSDAQSEIDADFTANESTADGIVEVAMRSNAVIQDGYDGRAALAQANG